MVPALPRRVWPVLHLRPGVKEHYLSWLAEERPDLMELHARMYRRSYAPSSERARISDLVQDLLRKHRGVTNGTGR